MCEVNGPGSTQNKKFPQRGKDILGARLANLHVTPKLINTHMNPTI